MFLDVFGLPLRNLADVLIKYYPVALWANLTIYAISIMNSFCLKKHSVFCADTNVIVQLIVHVCDVLMYQNVLTIVFLPLFYIYREAGI